MAESSLGATNNKPTLVNIVVPDCSASCAAVVSAKVEFVEAPVTSAVFENSARDNAAHEGAGAQLIDFAKA